ncbi:hypothetical protein [Streptomyces acidicola]|uniref:hypothetical protein n=1 Tax=Streptomyces acidicola TaxID=2596892 RepID=UPI0034342FD2
MSEHDEREAQDKREPQDKREAYEDHELHELHDEREDHASHAGNRTVNHGPDEQGQGPTDQDGEGLGSGRRKLEALVSGADGSDGHGGPGDEGGPDGLGSDELALRRMLHQAVLEIEPRDGTLEHLRRAVPARRARKRHAVVGLAAAALFVGTAIPAVVHVSNSTGSGADPSNVANSSQAQGGAAQDKGRGSDAGSLDGSSGSAGKETGKDSGKDKDDPDKGATGGGATGPAPSASPASTPTCTAAELGGTSASVASPDSSGAVYGSFRVANVSGTSCAVTGPGTVSVTAQGAADPAKIFVADHVAGDAAAGLPDPSVSAAQMVLQPGAAYVVKFAWVPSETCPTVSDPDPSPEPSPTDNPATADGSATEGGGTAPQLFIADGVADGSVVVSHTTAVGTPATATTVANACAGTVYRTGLLPGS